MPNNNQNKIIDDLPIETASWSAGIQIIYQLPPLSRDDQQEDNYDRALTFELEEKVWPDFESGRDAA